MSARSQILELFELLELERKPSLSFRAEQAGAFLRVRFCERAG
jgi:hypothetical protein